MIGRVLKWLGSLDLAVLLALLTAILGTRSFIEIADELSNQETQSIDERLIRSLRDPDNPADPIGPRWLEEAVRDLSSLGSPAVIPLLATIVAGYLLINRKIHALVLVLVATTGGLLLSILLKEVFDRPRPDAVLNTLSYVNSTSFPSGHAMLSAVVYLTLGALLAGLSDRWGQKMYFLAVAIVLSFLVGASRVYLGVHYPTDVLAGWSVGLSWATLCWLAARYLKRRGGVEKMAD